MRYTEVVKVLGLLSCLGEVLGWSTNTSNSLATETQLHCFNFVWDSLQLNCWCSTSMYPAS